MAYLFFVIVNLTLFAQTTERVQRILFYNCENLFDSSNNPERLDDEYTPEGDRHWSRSRMYTKLQHLDSVLGRVCEEDVPMLIGLAEVENDSMLIRLTHQRNLWRQEYRYLITDSEDPRGINVGLLYQPMDYDLRGWCSVRVRMPEGSRPTRDLLHAWGVVVGGDTLDVIVCHLPSKLNGRKSEVNRACVQSVIRNLCDSLNNCRCSPHILVMGDMNDRPDARGLRRTMGFGNVMHNMMDGLQRELLKGKRPYGTHKYQGEWSILDQFWVDSGLLPNVPIVANSDSACLWVDGVDIVHYPFMMTEDVTHMGHRPMRSYYGFRYEGGYSDHLPIMIELHIRY